jgi:CubicO group peptidase (beta-lactamase class C family)
MKCKTILLTIALTSWLNAGVDDATSQAGRTIRKFMRIHFIPGLSVTVANGGKVVWSEGFGYADKGKSVPVNTQTRMRIGSVSKTVTSTGAAILYENGLLDLDAPVQQYIPSFPEKRWPITTRQLMGHISGIRHYRENEMLGNQFFPSVMAGLEIFSADTLLFEPRTKYSYSSYAWNLVSAIMENVAKQDFLTFMERNVFNPLDNAQYISRTPRFITDELGNLL